MTIVLVAGKQYVNDGLRKTESSSFPLRLCIPSCPSSASSSSPSSSFFLTRTELLQSTVGTSLLRSEEEFENVHACLLANLLACLLACRHTRKRSSSRPQNSILERVKQPTLELGRLNTSHIYTNTYTPFSRVTCFESSFPKLNYPSLNGDPIE